MKLEKRYELQKKRLERMENQVVDLQEKLAKSEENSLQFELLKEELHDLQDEWRNLIDELKTKEDKRMKEWQEQVDALKKQRAEYSVLLQQLAVITKKLK